MKTSFFFSLGIGILLCTACGSGTKELPVVSLDHPDQTAELKFSEIADHLHCVQLHDCEELLIASYTRLWVGEKYLITLGEKDIQQFTSDGHYLRKLASSGKGPNEFQSIYAFTVDEAHDLLYYSHQGDRENIQRIDLKTGKPLERLNVKAMTFSMQAENHKLHYNPYMPENPSAPLLYTIDFQGKRLDSIPQRTAIKTEGKIFQISRMVPDRKNEFHVNLDDTLFKIENNSLRPVLSIEYGDKFNVNTNPEGASQEFLLTTSQFYLINKQELIFKSSENMVSMQSKTTGNYKIDKNDFTITSIENFYIDPLGYSQKELPTFWIGNKKVVIRVDAITLKDMARTQREKGETLSPELERLDRELNEEDNPIFIVGDLK